MPRPTNTCRMDPPGVSAVKYIRGLTTVEGFDLESV